MIKTISLGITLLWCTLLQFDVNAQRQSRHNLPQGTIKAELYFSEWHGRMENASCDIYVKGDSITILQNEKTNLTGDKVILKGILLLHKTGIWIIGDNPNDINAEEIGGCTGGPVPIDIEKLIIEWC